MPPPPPIIAVLGSLNVDLVTRTPRVPAAGETLLAGSFSTGYGGKGANQAVACARLSRTAAQAAANAPGAVDVRMLGAVGVDEFSGGFVASLRADGVGVEGVRTVAGTRTGVAAIVVEEGSGENRIMVSPGANWCVEARALVPVGTALAVLQLEVPMEVVLLNVADAKARGIDVLINPAPAVALPEEVYRGLGHLVVNESEAAVLAGRAAGEITPEADLTAVAADFVGRGVRNVIITLGSAGVFYHTAARQADGLPGKLVAAKKVQVVDTTAAGDTFVGAYAVAVARSTADSTEGSFDIDAAIAFANRAAAQTVQRKGAQSAIPWVDEVPAA